MIFDISRDEVAKYIVADDATLDAWVRLLKRYPDRFPFGSDAVAPKTQADYLKAFDAYIGACGSVWTDRRRAR